MENLITSGEVAKRLRVSPRTVQRMAADGRLVPVRTVEGLNNAYLFDPADVEAQIDPETVAS